MKTQLNLIWIIGKMHEMHYRAIEHNLIELKDSDWNIVIWTDSFDNVHPDFHEYTSLLPDGLVDRLSNHHAARTPAGTKIRIPHLVDLIRYYLLIQEGGAYMDCDEFLLCTPDQYFDTTKTNFLMEHKYMATNSHIYVPNTSSPILNGMLELLDNDNYDSSDWASTGPHLVTTYLLSKYASNLPEDISRNQYGYPYLYQIKEDDLYPDVHLIPEEVFPIKWTRYHKMINEGIPFDMNEYREKGYKIVGLFGSQLSKGSYKDGDIEVTFMTNTGTHTFVHGDKGIMKY